MLNISKHLNFTLFIVVLMASFTLQAQQTSVSEFLHRSRNRYEQTICLPVNQWPTLHFVLGNESADLDSIASSIAYAYLNNAIPLLNITKAELSLRKDTLYLFDLLKISKDDLLFLDDGIPFDILLSNKKLRITLVDHNRLRSSQEAFAPFVEAIVDHHFDENQRYPLLTNENKTIMTVGSTATLIAEKAKEDAISPDLAVLLLGAILMDTANLNSKEKTKEKDKQAVATLRKIGSSVIPSDFYDKLVAAKNDIAGLTPAMLLSKDFKAYSDGDIVYGISSMPQSVSWWSGDEEALLPILEQFSRERNLSWLIVLMHNQEPQGPKRKILVYSQSEKLVNAFAAYVKTDETLNKILLPGPAAADKRLLFYVSPKALARKELQPLLQQLPSNLGS